MRVYILMMIVAAAATYLLVPVVLRLALRLGAVTAVRARDVHTVPIPRMGGVAMYAGMAVAYAIGSQIPYLSRVLAPGSAAWGVLMGAGVMCLIGVLDDIVELVWYAKLAGEVLAAAVMAWQGVTLSSVPFMGLTVGSSRMTLFITVLTVVVVSNAVNFMDGLDGLAAGMIGIAGLAFYLYSYMLTRNANPGDFTSVACAITAPLAGACIGFLPHNFHPARIFMGDSGALMLGAVIAGAGIQVTGQIDPANTDLGYALPTWMPLLVPFVVILLPLIDFVWAVIRRMAAGHSPFHPDAGHLHHRLLRSGYSHRGAVLVLYMWAFIVSFSWVALVQFSTSFVAAVFVGAALVGLVVTWMAAKTSVRNAGKHFAQDAPARPQEETLMDTVPA